MLIDQFWKILFIILVGTGCWFWWKASSKKKAYKNQVTELAELIDVRAEALPKTATQAEARTFRAIGVLLRMAQAEGDKFEPRTPLMAAGEINQSSTGLADTLSDIFEDSYANAVAFGFLEDEDALWRLEQGSPPKITAGIWSGQNAVVGYHIPPGVNDSLAKHLANRLLVPEGVAAAMRAGDITREVEGWADRMKKLEIIDLSEHQQIKKEYETLKERARAN